MHCNMMILPIFSKCQGIYTFPRSRVSQLNGYPKHCTFPSRLTQSMLATTQTIKHCIPCNPKVTWVVHRYSRELHVYDRVSNQCTCIRGSVMNNSQETVDAHL